MGLHVTAADTLLKQFIAQETSACPEYFCPTLCTVGLLKANPTRKDDGTGTVEYWTNELRTLPTGTCEAPGYQRDVIGKIIGGEIVEELKKMRTPSEGTTRNGSIILFGENTNVEVEGTGDNWPAVTHFGIFNALYGDDQEATSGGIAKRFSTHLVLWGALTGDPVVVEPQHVPLFRTDNFTLTFTSN